MKSKVASIGFRAAVGLALLGVSGTAHAGKREDEYARAVAMANDPNDSFARLAGREALADMFPRLRKAQQDVVQQILETARSTPASRICVVIAAGADGSYRLDCSGAAPSPRP